MSRRAARAEASCSLKKTAMVSLWVREDTIRLPLRATPAVGGGGGAVAEDEDAEEAALPLAVCRSPSPSALRTCMEVVGDDGGRSASDASELIVFSSFFSGTTRERYGGGKKK